MKNSLRTLKKRLKMGRDLDIQNLVLSRLPHALIIRLSEKYGLVKENYKSGDTIVSINSGDMIELAGDYKNGDRKIEYRNIWEHFGSGHYEKEYDDDFGGTLSLLPCDLIFKSPRLWKKYDHVYRLATKKEINLK